MWLLLLPPPHPNKGPVALSVKLLSCLGTDGCRGDREEPPSVSLGRARRAAPQLSQQLGRGLNLTMTEGTKPPVPG